MVKEIQVPAAAAAPVRAPSPVHSAPVKTEDGRATPPEPSQPQQPQRPPPPQPLVRRDSYSPPPPPRLSPPPGADVPSIDFHDVYAELQRFSIENGASLSIPLSHPALSRIIDGLSESSEGIETLSKRRWEEQFSALEKFKDGTGHTRVPDDHPTLGNWARIQREHYKLYERGMPNALTKKRFGKLKSIGGFGGGDGEGELNGGEGLAGKPEDVVAKVQLGEDAAQRDGDDTDAAPKGGKRKPAIIGNGTKDTSSTNGSTRKRKEREDDAAQGETKAASNDNGERRLTQRKEAPSDQEASKQSTATASTNPSCESVVAGTRLSVYWPDDDAYYPGVVSERHLDDPTGRPHVVTIRYDDGGVETVDLMAETFRILDGKEGVPSKQAASAKPAVKEEMGGKREKIKGKCDLCEKRDGFKGHNLQKCRACGVLVHELCYGMIETNRKDPNFICHACNAVGKEVEVNVPSKIGGCGKQTGKKREKMRQAVRPFECLLCTHDKGIHAMHPLRDQDGPEGRQLVIDYQRDEKGKKEKRLAWVHTLCANVISANPRTRGDVYGLTKNGNFDGDEDSEEEFGGEDNSNGKGGSDPGVLASFAISTECAYANNIKEHRDELKCFVCNKKDKVWRLPVQCIAGEAEEIGRWKSRHKKKTECFEGMHVGCARWGCVEQEGSHLDRVGGDKKRCRLVYFTPGRDVEVSENVKDDWGDDEMCTIAHCYCKTHARDIVLNNPDRRKKKAPSPSPDKAKTKQPRRSSDKGSNKNVRAKPKSNASGQAQSSFKKSMTTIRQKSGKKMNTLKKRKAGAKNAPAEKVGASSSKRARVEVPAESAVQFPVRGKAASALAGMPGLPVRYERPPQKTTASIGNAPAANASGGGVVGGLLQRMSSGGSMQGNDTGQVTGKRKAGPEHDLPQNGSSAFKRVKTEK